MSDVKVVPASELPFRAVLGDGAEGLELARLYRHPKGAATLQLARVAPGGISKRHAHEWDQANGVSRWIPLPEVSERVVDSTPLGLLPARRRRRSPVAASPTFGAPVR